MTRIWSCTFWDSVTASDTGTGRAGRMEMIIRAAGLGTHVLTAGDGGTPVLLLHGAGIDCASLSYGPVICDLGRRCRVYAPDWPGYGRSDKPEIKYTTAYYIRFLGDLMDSLGLGKASLIGLSMGGAVALGMALQRPDRVERLVLVDSYGLGREVPWKPLTYLYAKTAGRGGFIWAVGRMPPWAVKWSLGLQLREPRLVSTELVDKVRQEARRERAGLAFSSWLASEVSWRGLATDYSGRLGEIKCPVLILHGREDRLVPMHQAYQAHALIGGSRIHVVDHCGHWLPREQPQLFVRAVLDFLGG